MKTDGRQLLFREKVPKSNTNTVITVPNLTHEGLVLSQIDFQSEAWHFEVSIKCGSTDLVRLMTTYFQHSHNVDLTGHRSRLEEGDKVEMYLKPKQAPKDLDMMICYTFVPTNGSVYHQSSDRLIDLRDSSIISDIAQGMRPTFLHIKCDVPISELALVPKFSDPGTDDANLLEYRKKYDGSEDNYDIEFSNELSHIIPLLRHYQLEVKLDTNNVEAMIHFMARGFRQSA